MKTISTVVLTLATLVALVACQKKNDGGSNSAQPVPVTTCAPGQVVPAGYYCQNGVLVSIAQAGGTQLATNIYMQNSYMEGLLMIMGTQAMVQPISGGSVYGNVPSIETYQGQITITGTLQVLNQSLCGAPIGAYSVSGTGYLMGGQIGQTTLTMSGGTLMQLQIGSAVIYQGNRLGILSSQLTVNGVPCGAITTY